MSVVLKVYKVFHKKMGRYMACIKYVDGTRKTISWARHTYSISHNVDIPKNLHVDHIDGNKLNDDVSNLQLLSIAENNRKSVIERGKESKEIKLLCPICNTYFYRGKRKVKKYEQTCSRKCGGIMSSRKNLI